MKKAVFTFLRYLLMPVFSLIHQKRLPHFKEDFDGKRAFMIAELPGDRDEWIGQRRRKTHLGNTHPWNRYFNKPLKTKPQTLAEIEAFLCKCKYLSDQKTRSQSDFWEPPDEFEKRKKGDCEDHAIWAWRHLHDLGYQTRFVLGNCGNWHAWVHIFVNGRVYLLEATQKHRWFPDVNSYDAWWSVERTGKKKFAYFLHSENQDVAIPDSAYN